MVFENFNYDNTSILYICNFIEILLMVFETWYYSNNPLMTKRNSKNFKYVVGILYICNFIEISPVIFKILYYGNNPLMT